MTPQEIFSLGSAKSQIVSAMELIDQARRNLNFSKVYDLDEQMISLYRASWVNDLVDEIIKEKVK